MNPPNYLLGLLLCNGKAHETTSSALIFPPKGGRTEKSIYDTQRSSESDICINEDGPPTEGIR